MTKHRPHNIGLRSKDLKLNYYHEVHIMHNAYQNDICQIMNNLVKKMKIFHMKDNFQQL